MKKESFRERRRVKNFMPYLYLIGCTFLHLQTNGQQQDTRSLQESAKRLVTQGDFNNAIIALTRALQQEPDNSSIVKDLASAQYLQRDFAKALETLKPLLDRRDADLQTYQIAGSILRAKDDLAEGEKLYKKAIKKFPESGSLYNDYAQLLWAKKDNGAIRQLEKGMEVDPNFINNYYDAARYYNATGDRIWSVIYAEIFVNMESFSRRTIEIKSLLLDNYKKLLAEADMLKTQTSKNAFIVAYLSSLTRQSADVAAGLTPESLTMARTRFVLEWDDKYASKFPYRLFEFHRQLLKEGLFESYNQWLFGPIQNLTAFQNWTNKHGESYAEFTNFQRAHIFKLPAGQNYQNRKE